MRTEQRLPQRSFSRFICLCQGHNCRSSRKVTGVHRTQSLSGREQSAWQPWHPSCRQPWPLRPPTCPCGKPRPSPSSWPRATMSWYFQPTSCPSLPREQNLLPCFSLRTFRAEGMTIFFFLSYGGGTPSNVCRRLRASLPLSVLCGVMPRTVLQKIFEGALKWKAPRLGLTLHLFLRKSRYFSLLR